MQEYDLKRTDILVPVEPVRIDVCVDGSNCYVVKAWHGATNEMVFVTVTRDTWRDLVDLDASRSLGGIREALDDLRVTLVPLVPEDE